MGRTVAEIIAERKKMQEQKESPAETTTPTPDAAPKAAPKAAASKSAPKASVPKTEIVVPAPDPMAGVEMVLSDEENEILATLLAQGQSVPLPSGVPTITNSKLNGFVRDGYQPTREIAGVILDWAFENVFYDRPYVEGHPSAPACFAVARDVHEMAPTADVPVPQSESCSTCPQNEFESAANGRGKACRNSIRLLVMDEADNSVWRLRVPPTSINRCLRVLVGLSKRGPVPFMRVTVVSEPLNEFQGVGITPSSPITEVEEQKHILTLLKTHRDEILSPLDTTGYEPPPARKGRTF